jgi:iron complex outermembrane recepter protein
LSLTSFTFGAQKINMNLKHHLPQYFKRAALALLIITGSMEAVFAQNPGNISGSLKGADGKPVDFATVSIIRAKDTAIVKGTLSTETGAYVFDHIPAGIYLVKASSVGYQTTMSGKFSITADSVGVIVPLLTMSPTTKTLGTVTITGTKPLIEHNGDKTVLNIAGSILAAGNSAMDILQRAPGVSIDKDDNIGLKGKQGVTVMINDKLTYLSAAQLATLLRSTDGNSIQSIELIPNPSAKYDAAGNSGIINIKLKKMRQAGTNGTLTLGAGYGLYGKDNESLSINHQQGNVNVFGTFSHIDDKRKTQVDIDRVVTHAPGDNTFITEYSTLPRLRSNNSYRAGIDYNTSPKNTAGVLVSGYSNAVSGDNTDLNYIGSQPGTVNSYQRTLSSVNEHYRNFTLNLNDRYIIDSAGQELSVNADYSRFNNSAGAQYNTYFYNPDGSVMMPPAFLRNQSPSKIRVHTANADYVLPFSKTLKLEAGAKYSDVNTDNVLNAQELANGTYVNDARLTNHFIYDEKIGAGYLNLSKSYDRLTIQAGLRAEHTSSDGTLIQADRNSVRRSYLDFFPSLFINKVLDDKNELGLSISRRIDRPGYDVLNPFIYYLDQYTFTEGNPFLKPQYTNKAELTFSYNKTINISAGYSHTSDYIAEIFQTVGDSSFDVHRNISSQNAITLTFNASYQLAKWWSGNVDVTSYYLHLKADTLLGSMLSKGKVTIIIKATQTFVIAKGYKAELYSEYDSPDEIGIFDTRPYYDVDAGISHSFASRRASIKLSVRDLFNIARNDSHVNYQADIINVRQKYETRVARISFTYNFGSSQPKTREHKSGADEESKRVKN